MIRHGRHVPNPNPNPKQKHFPPVLVAIFNISGEMLLFRALARNMAAMTNIECLSPLEYLKWLLMPVGASV